MGKRENDGQMVEHLRGSRHQYQHGQHVGDIDVRRDVGVDAVEVVGSLGIGGNVSAVAEKMVTGARL